MVVFFLSSLGGGGTHHHHRVHPTEPFTATLQSSSLPLRPSPPSPSALSPSHPPLFLFFERCDVHLGRVRPISHTPVLTGRNKALCSGPDCNEVGQSMQGTTGVAVGGERALCPHHHCRYLILSISPYPAPPHTHTTTATGQAAPASTSSATQKGERRGREGGGQLVHSASVKRFHSSTMPGRSRQVQGRERDEWRERQRDGERQRTTG